jgi:hypothetical protein
MAPIDRPLGRIENVRKEKINQFHMTMEKIYIAKALDIYKYLFYPEMKNSEKNLKANVFPLVLYLASQKLIIYCLCSQKC